MIHAFVNHWVKEQYSFVGLPDPQHAAANRYGQEECPAAFLAVVENFLARLPD